MSGNQEEVIRKLGERAKEVLELKKKHRQKRPIVIEFSGSPKSGKTSCINSLEIFLKRNGFSVKVVQERASVCPVSDKQSPMFNIWTACESLAGMIGTLENKDNGIDVLILDRGIFDAICWFDWLVSKGKMELRQRKVIESFLLQEELCKSIDIVFSFTTDPDSSIEREFATLLTKKTGTIMNRKVLGEYKKSVKRTVIEKKNYFHNVFEIDTTSKGQNDVGKDVTEKTLEALRDLLVEKIGVLKRTPELEAMLVSEGIIEFSKLESLHKRLVFKNREDVEKDDSLIQLLPIAVITNRKKDKVLLIRKNNHAVSEMSPEKGKMLLYVGGHSRREDCPNNGEGDLLKICKGTVKREIKEELGVSVALRNSKPFLIYIPDSDKSRKHLAVCFVIIQDEDTYFKPDPHELVQKKGKTVSGKFLDIQELRTKDLEPWSIEILKSVFNYNLENAHQLSMFD